MLLLRSGPLYLYHLLHVRLFMTCVEFVNERDLVRGSDSWLTQCDDGGIVHRAFLGSYVGVNRLR